MVLRFFLFASIFLFTSCTTAERDNPDDPHGTNYRGNQVVSSSSVEPGYSSEVALLSSAKQSSSSSTSRSSSSLAQSSSSVASSSNVDNPGVVEIENFNLDATTSFDKIYITGSVIAAKAEPIVRIEFITAGSGWVSYNESSVTGPITLPSVISVQLSEAKIDLMNPSIPCGTHILTVKVCIDANCTAGKFAQESKQFTKPEALCALSSSGGQASSSSEAVWRFGPGQYADVYLNSSIPIGSGSFKLTGDDSQPDMEITGGKVRSANNLCADDVIPGASYSGKENCLGSLPATTMSCGGDLCVVQDMGYYLVYLDDGSRYLIKFIRGGTYWYSWPKNCTYWLATEGPK